MKKSVLCALMMSLTVVFSVAAFTLAAQASDVEGVPGGETETGYAYVTGLTSGRARSLVGVVLALVSVTIGWRVKSRAAAGSGRQRTMAMSALVLGLIAVLLSVVHLAGNAGGFGAGGGKAGAIVALVLGVTGATLGGTVLRIKNVPAK